MAVKKKKPIKKDLVLPESLSSELTQNIEEDALPIAGEELENTEENVGEEESLEKNEPIVNDISNEENGKGKRGLFKTVVIWSGIAIVIGALLGISWKLAYERGIAVGEAQVQEKQEKEAAVQEKIATPTRTEISKGKYTIEVLNGSGISGEAARVKTLLEKEGFIISTVGNAEESNIEETAIQVKSSVAKDWIDLLKTALGKSLVMSDPTSLNEEKTTDVVITVGSKKAE